MIIRILNEEYSKSKGNSDLLAERMDFTLRKRDTHGKLDHLKNLSLITSLESPLVIKTTYSWTSGIGTLLRRVEITKPSLYTIIIDSKSHVWSYTDEYFYKAGFQLQPNLSNSKVSALICYVSFLWTLIAGTHCDPITIQKTQSGFLRLLVSRTVCLVLPEAFLSAISSRKVNLLLRRVHVHASSRQSQDIHVLMIYTAYKSRHPVCFLLAKWLHYIHHSYLKCLHKSVSQQAFIECLKKAFHINQCAISQ